MTDAAETDGSVTSPNVWGHRPPTRDQLLLTESKLATLTEVHEHTEGAPVELWINRHGRVVVRAYNECGNAFTDVDLGDLLEWARNGGTEGLFGLLKRSS